MTETHLKLLNISKNYGGVAAVSDVSIEVRRGEIHALVGENGAGKSTLAAIATGAVVPDAGKIVLGGEEVTFSRPYDAIRAGVTIIDQELALLPARSVVDNVFLGSEPTRGGVVRQRELRERFDEINEKSGFRLQPDARVGDLRTAEQQKVEILRALARGAELIVMDEPTAALGGEESEKLFQVVRDLKAEGTTIIYISHFLREVLDLADTVSVLRDGRHVKTVAAADETLDSLVVSMIGRSLGTTYPPKRPVVGEPAPVLSVQGLRRGREIRDVSFSVRAGEILGLAGLIGSGRTEVARAIFGADSIDGGTISVDGVPVTFRTPADAIRSGIAMLPEDRKGQGLFLRKSIVENSTLPYLDGFIRAGLVDKQRERREVRALADEIGVKAASLEAPVESLSGGNQQKVMFGRWLLRRPRVLIVDEPTRGVDVGAKQTIYELLCRLAAEGMAVIVISSELEEVLGLAHRILVMRLGSVVGDFPGDAAADQIMRAAFSDSFASHDVTAGSRR